MSRARLDSASFELDQNDQCQRRSKDHQLAGAKIHQRCWQEAPDLGVFFRHQVWVGLSAGYPSWRGVRCAYSD